MRYNCCTGILSAMNHYNIIRCTINSKINGTPKGVYLPILKLLSIIIKANLFAHNLCLFYGQLNLVRLKSSVASKWTVENIIFITQKIGATPKNRLHFKNQHKKYIN